MTVRRISYPFEFNATLFGSEGWDLLGIALLLPLSIVLLLRSKRIRLAEGILTALLLVELAASIQLVLNPFGISNPVLGHFVDAATQLFYALGTLSPYLMILMFGASVYVLSVKPTSSEIKTKIRTRSTLSMKKIFLILSILISVFAAWYPYSQEVNPKQDTVSVDTPQYVKFINEMTASPRGLLSAFSEVNNGDRPSVLITIYALQRLTEIELRTLVNYLPLILGPLLVIAVYALTNMVFHDERITSIALILTATSHYIVVGIYGGFFANWFALILMIVYVSFTIKASRRFDIKNLMVASLLLISILFTHPYTWAPLLLSTLVFFLATVSGNISTKTRYLAKAALVLLIPNIVAENVKMIILNSVGGFSGNYAVASTSVSIEQFFLRFSNLEYTFSTYVGGFLSNPLILSLSFLALLTSQKTEFTKLISSLLLAISIPIFFGDFVIQSRLIYLIPFPVMAAVFLGQSERYKESRRIFLPLVFLISLNYMLWGLTNLPLP
jgi:hypothetical protein